MDDVCMLPVIAQVMLTLSARFICGRARCAMEWFVTSRRTPSIRQSWQQ